MEAILTALISLFAGIYVGKMTGNSDLDTSSGWRKNLLDLASKYTLTYDDAQRVRASIRMFRHKNPVYCSFDWFTNVMIDHLDGILKPDSKTDQSETQDESTKGKFTCAKCNSVVLNEEDTKIVRLFANFLLKYHFDNRRVLGPISIFNKNYKSKYNKLVQQTNSKLNEYLNLKRNDCGSGGKMSYHQDNMSGDNSNAEILIAIFNAFILFAASYFLIKLFIWLSFGAVKIVLDKAGIFDYSSLKNLVHWFDNCGSILLSLFLFLVFVLRQVQDCKGREEKLNSAINDNQTIKIEAEDKKKNEEQNKAKNKKKTKNKKK